MVERIVILIIIQNLMGFIKQGKNLKRSLKFAFAFIEISWGLSRFSYHGDTSISVGL